MEIVYERCAGLGVHNRIWEAITSMNTTGRWCRSTWCAASNGWAIKSNCSRELRLGKSSPEPVGEGLFQKRRLADRAFSNSRTWPEIQWAHQTWWHHYNAESHYAHRERQDGRHSPEAVLRGVLGRTFPEEILSRALYATQFTRQIDRHGFVRFKHWRFYGERGLAGEDVSVWVYEGNLKVEYQATALSLYPRVVQRAS